MKYSIVLISDSKSINATLQTHEILINNLLKFTKFFFLNSDFSKNKIKYANKKFNFNKNFKLLDFKNNKELKKFLDNNNLIVWNNFGFYLKDLFLHLLLKKTNKKQIVISNLGNIQWSLNFSNENFITSYCKYLQKKIDKFFMMLAIMLGLINKIDMRFQSGKKKLAHDKNFFVKKYRYVNSYFYDEYLIKKNSYKNEYITHIDMNLNHADEVRLRGKLENYRIKEHYDKLNIHLKYLGKIFKKKIVICIHPLYDLKKTKSYFPKYSVYKFKTKDFIEKSFIVTFFDSSVIFKAVYLKKNLIIFKNKSLGKSLYEKSKKYQELLNIPFVDISYKQTKSKKVFLSDFNKSKKTITKYINDNMLSNHKSPSYKEILNYLNGQSSY